MMCGQACIHTPVCACEFKSSKYGSTENWIFWKGRYCNSCLKYYVQFLCYFLYRVAIFKPCKIISFQFNRYFSSLMSTKTIRNFTLSKFWGFVSSSFLVDVNAMQ